MASQATRLTDEDLRRVMAELGVEPGDELNGFGSLDSPRGALPLQKLRVLARIDGLLARVELSQTYLNQADVPLEVTYIFPLPDRAGVTEFRVEIAGRTVRGTIQERGQARQAYEKAIEAGHRAAIAEEERPNVFMLRVGNLMPGEQATVHLSLAEILPMADGEATFRFPLVVAPRYIPGAPLPGPAVGPGTADDTDRVPDASRITPPVLLPGWPSPVALEIVVELSVGSIPITDIRSSLHGVWLDESETNSRGVQQLRVLPGHKLDRDFILRFKLAGDVVRSSLVLQPDPSGKPGGTFALTLVPPVCSAADVSDRPRSVAFVLDRSGSMEGWKMVSARRAVERMVETLRPIDRFSLLAFDNSIEGPWGSELLIRPATARAVAEACAFLATVEARGGTELDDALQAALQTLRDHQEGDRVIVLVTDGQVGDENRLIHGLGSKLNGIRIFTIGIDQAVNASLLHRLADLTGGACELVESEPRLEERMEAIHRLLDPPVLTVEKLNPAQSGLKFERNTFVPRRNPDLFSGSPVLVLGRYQGEPRGVVELVAQTPDGKPWARQLSPEVTSNPAVVSAWARGRVRQLEDDYQTARDSRQKNAIEKELVQLSVQQSVLCRFTAYVAVDESEVVNAGGRVLAVTQAVEMPAGWVEPRFLSAPPHREILANAMVFMFESDVEFCQDLAPPPPPARSVLPGPERVSPRGLSVPRKRKGAIPPSDGLSDSGELPMEAPENKAPVLPPARPDGPRFVRHMPVLSRSYGIGLIYRAFDSRDGIEVELEIFDHQDRSVLALLARDINAEAQAIIASRHTALVSITEVIENHDHLTIVRHVDARHPLACVLVDPPEVARILAVVAELIQQLLDQGRTVARIHGEMILLRPDGTVTVDRLLLPCNTFLDGVLKPPVAVPASQPAGEESAVYSLGVLLLEMLTGLAPASLDVTMASDMLESRRRAVSGNQHVATLAQLEELCLRAIAPGVGGNSLSVDDLVVELRGIALKQKSVAQHPPQRTEFWK